MIIGTKHARLDNHFLQALSIGLIYLLKFFFYRQLTDLDEGLNGFQLLSAYSTNIAAAMAVALLVFFAKKIWSTILLLVLCDIWLLANIYYFNANFIPLSWGAITTITELHGFEESISSFFSWKQGVFPITTMAAIFLLLGLQESSPNKEKTAWSTIRWYGLICILFMSIGIISRHHLSFTDPHKWNIHDEEQNYLKAHSPLGHLGKTFAEMIRTQWVLINAELPFSNQEQHFLNQMVLSDTSTITTPTGHLVYILIESLESWALMATDQTGAQVCPNLNRFIQTRPVILSLGVETQQMYGRSGDGQLITQTGLLPLIQGVACLKYGANTYPNLAHFFPNSIVLNPYRGVWNQHVTTYSYGFKKLREPERHRKGTDSLVFVWAKEELQHAQQPTYILALTIDTHAPFHHHSRHLTFNSDYSETEQAYLQCVHTMDRHLGQFLNWADTAAIMKNATLVITADHNHFPHKNNRGMCPLIISSPQLPSTIHIQSAYQMDIFPTVLHLIHQDTYSWKGLGRNLLDSASTRPFSIKEAYRLSDKLIRTNYFEQ